MSEVNMERRGLVYLREQHPAAKKYLGVVMDDIKVMPSAQVLNIVFTGFFMVEYFGLPWFDIQPAEEEIRDMFYDLVGRGMVRIIAEAHESADGLLNVDYNIAEAADYVGDWLVQLFDDPKMKDEFVKLAELCAGVVNSPRSDYSH